MWVVRGGDRSYRLEGDALVGLIASTEQLTVASVRVVPGGTSSHVSRCGDTLVFVENGTLLVHVESAGERDVFELGRWDAAYVPLGAGYRLEGAEQDRSTQSSELRLRTVQPTERRRPTCSPLVGR